MSIIQNTIIENPVVIREVRLSKKELNNFIAGKKEISASVVTLATEIEKEEEKTTKSKGILEALMCEKEELQGLIAKGNSGLTNKLIETQKKIKVAKAELEETEESLKEISILKEEQVQTLEKSLYSEFMENGKLTNEYNKNAQALQLQYYSFMYKAFEVAKELDEMGREYFSIVSNSFNNSYPNKDFTVTFPSNPFLNEVRNNFKHPTKHWSPFGKEHIEKFVVKFEGIENNKDFTIYK